jgi:uncharacterized protein YegP (UPF0339 family)
MAENVRYEPVRGEGEVITGFTFVVVGDNGETQARGERYDSESNARRGAADLTRTLLKAVAEGELDMTVGAAPADDG